MTRDLFIFLIQPLDYLRLSKYTKPIKIMTTNTYITNFIYFSSMVLKLSNLSLQYLPHQYHVLFYIK